MSTLLAIIISTGAACVSPVAYEPGGMTVQKVPCARIVQYHSANPFKVVQEPNVITAAAAKPKAVKKAVQKAQRKAKKSKRKARR
jgi:hypothetical protein